VDRSPWATIDPSLAITLDWIALPPRHSYGTSVDLDPLTYIVLSKVGRYRLSAQYSSGGLLEGYQGAISPASINIGRLPAKSWKGEIESPPVTIDVTPNKN